MSIETLQPTAHNSPDTTATAFNSHSNTGCSGGCDGISTNPDQSYRCHTIPNSVKPNIVDKRLKMSWVITLTGGSTGTVISTIEYTVNGGTNWSIITQITNGSQTSSADIALGAGQNLTQVQVRCNCDGSGPSTGLERGQTMVVSNIRVEVEYQGNSGASGGMM